MERLYRRAQENPVTIVLPEGEEERTLRAADIILDKGIANLILLGDAETMERKSEQWNLNIDKAQLMNPKNSKFLHDFTTELYRLRSHKGLTMEQAAENIRQPLFFGAMLVKWGLAQGSVAGAINTTGNVMRAAIQIIGMKPGISVVSSSFMMVLPDNIIYTFSDCAVVPEPDAEQLASIAISASETHQALVGEEPLVALLSFSTKGSAEHHTVDKIRQAFDKVRKLRPDLNIDGELQFDAAIIPAIGERKSPGSTVAGKANVFIFPDLNSGNIAYKITQRLAKARAIGPIVQGLTKPAFDLSRGCSVQDIVDVVAVNAVIAASESN
jgi:phosphate acetyltransferase